jgi:hypothetical protein
MIWRVLVIGANAGLITYALWLSRRERARVLLRRLAVVCGVTLVLSALFGVIIGLRAGSDASGGESIAPSQKARILAEGIAEAMNCTALGFVAFSLPALVSLVLFLRARWRGRTP